MKLLALGVGYSNSEERNGTQNRGGIAVNCKVLLMSSRGKSLLELWGTTFLPDWQPPLIFVWFTSKSHEH